MSRPPDLPYITIQLRGDTWCPVLIDWSQETESVQVSDQLPDEEDQTMAKRAAVSWATRLGITYKRPIW